jgi:hypothetical protein
MKVKQESVLYNPISAIALQVFPVMKKYTEKAKDLLLGDDKKIPKQRGE